MSKTTPWFDRATPPVRNGLYECAVILTSAQKTLLVWGLLEWDGIGFKVPVPMIVKKWRGLTKEAQP